MVALVGESFGYIGDEAGDPSIDTVQWAKYQAALGNEYFVESGNAARVTLLSGTTFRIGAGASETTPQVIGGHGVVDVLKAPHDLTLPVPGSNGTLYYPIFGRRAWQATNATTFEHGASQTARTFPSNRNKNPGILDDQPLALVSITRSGGTVTGAVVEDWRAIGYGKGSYLANSTKVMDYMSKPGYRFLIDGIEWVILLDGSRLQSPNLPQYGIKTEYTPSFIGETSSTRYLFGLNIPVKSYPRLAQFQAAGNVSIPVDSGWTLSVRLTDQGAPNTSETGAQLLAIPLVSGPSGSTRHGPTPVVQFTIPAGDAKLIRMWLVKEYGSGAAIVRNGGGIAGQVTTLAVRTGNDW